MLLVTVGRHAPRDGHDSSAVDEYVDRFRIRENLLGALARGGDRAEIEDERAQLDVGRDLLELGNRLVELGLRASGENEQAGRMLDDRLGRLDRETALSCQQSAGGERTGDAPVISRTLPRISLASAEAA